MPDSFESVLEQFENHVPHSNAMLLVLKAHLVIEVRLLEFIKARISSELFEEIEKSQEGSFKVRLLLARALAERDEVPLDNAHILWPALEQLGKLRNAAAHTLEHSGSSFEDKMRAFVQKMGLTVDARNQMVSVEDLHRNFRAAAGYLNSLLAIQRDPLLIVDELDRFSR